MTRRRRRRGSRWVARLSVAIGSVLLALFVSEVALRAAGYAPIHAIYSQPSMFWRHDDALGWSHEPGARGTYVGPRPFPVEFRAPVEINSLGLRGPEVGPRQPGELRVLLLGDSVAAGFEVAYEDTFGAVAEREAARLVGRPVRVVNAAVRGYGTDQSLLWYRARGRTLGADLVVLVFSRNDPNDNMTLHRMKRPFGKPAFALREGGSLELVGRPVPDYPLCSAHMLDESFEPRRTDGALNRLACFVQTRGAERSAAFTLAARGLAARPGLLRSAQNAGYPGEQRDALQETRRPGVDAPRDAAYRLTTALVGALAGDVRQDGASFVAVVGPAAGAQFDVAGLEARGVRFAVIPAPEDVPSAPVRFRNDRHFNERGHRAIGRELARVLVDSSATR